MFDAVGLPLRSLHREAIGQLSCRILDVLRKLEPKPEIVILREPLPLNLKP